MTPNVNPRTGIRYDVIDANDVPELLDTIIHDSTNVTVDEWYDQVLDEVIDAIGDTLDDYTPQAYRLAGEIREEVDDLIHDTLMEDSPNEECNYEYEFETPHGRLRLELGWLGGAPLIWVLKSPWIAPCRECSPCVPGAGDLNTPDPNGFEAYCLPPYELPEGHQLHPQLKD